MKKELRVCVSFANVIMQKVNFVLNSLARARFENFEKIIFEMHCHTPDMHNEHIKKSQPATIQSFVSHNFFLKNSKLNILFTMFVVKLLENFKRKRKYTVENV